MISILLIVFMVAMAVLPPVGYMLVRTNRHACHLAKQQLAIPNVDAFAARDLGCGD